MKKVQTIFNKFQSVKQFADIIGKPYYTVYFWKIRDNIPNRYWQHIIDCAKVHKIKIKLEDFI